MGARKEAVVDLFLATHKGIAVYDFNGHGWQLQRRGLTDQVVTTVIAREGVVLAGTRDGVFRSDDRGHSWVAASDGLRLRHVRWLAYHPDISDLEFAGTEPASIFVSRDGGGQWQEREEVAELRDRYEWMLPYSPEAGCIRGFAFHGQRVYAAAEDGALLRSDDGGERWRLAPGSPGHRTHGPREGQIHSDVHSVAVHPSSPELVVAPTGGGLFWSEDGGATWENRYRCYCRAVWLDPDDAQHLIFGPAVGVDRLGRIEESQDGGRSWQRVNDGLDAPWARHMVERFHQVGDSLLAILSNGQLAIADLGVWQWRTVAAETGFVNDVALMGETS